MARTSEVQENLDNQIISHISGLSVKGKKAVLNIVKTIADTEQDAEFEKKWAKAIPLDMAFQQIHDYIKTLEWKK